MARRREGAAIGCRSDVCGMAMTRGAVSVAARALDAGSTSSDVVTALTALLRLGVLPKSCRAAAIIIHGNGDSTGAVGELPANGFWTALTMLDIAVVATSTRACGCCFGVSTITSAVFGTDETDTLAVGAGSSAAFGSSDVLVCSVAVRAHRASRGGARLSRRLRGFVGGPAPLPRSGRLLLSLRRRIDDGLRFAGIR